MANIRLLAASAILRNLTRINVNKNVCLAIHREKHGLSGRLVCFMNRSSLCSTGKRNSFRGTHRLKHTITLPTEPIIDEKIVSPSTSISAAANEAHQANAVPTDTRIEKINYSAPNDVTLPEIPEPPTYLSFIEEPELTEYGLGGWTFTGVVQKILAYFHTSFDMPWWACIVSFTVIVKVLMFPLNLQSRKNSIIYRNLMNGYQVIYQDFMNARKSGDHYQAIKKAHDLNNFLQEHKAAPWKMFIPTLIQAPIFVSVYFALREMANTPEFTSFHIGGTLWFKDLAIPDQYFILPVITATTVWFLLKYTVVAGSVPPQLQKMLDSKAAKLIEVGIPAVIFLIIMNFPSAVLCYWTSSNLFLVGQTLILNTEPFKKYFHMPTPEMAPTPEKTRKSSGNKDFIESIKESFSNMRIAREIEQRELVNAMKFENIGKKPSRRTFKYDPTKTLPQNKTQKN